MRRRLRAWWREAPSRLALLSVVWVLPLLFRPVTPFGYQHGETNFQDVAHPGYDLNAGWTSHADYGMPISAPTAGLVVFAEHTRSSGWGSLLVVLADEPVDGEQLAWRIGHPAEIMVGVGDRVEAGQIVATVGDGGRPDLYLPHLHYDVVRVAALQRYSALLGLEGAHWPLWPTSFSGEARETQQELFDSIWVDPRTLHPAIDDFIRGASQ